MTSRNSLRLFFISVLNPKYRIAARFTAMNAINAPKLRISTDRSHPMVSVPM